MKIDPAVAKEIKTRLAGAYGSVILLVDGHRLSAQVARISKRALRYGVAIYVDGYIRGENLKVESEIGAKFYPLRNACALSTKAYAAHRKAFGKRHADSLRKKMTFQYREAFFRTGDALVAHLAKHCSSVELVATETVV